MIDRSVFEHILNLAVQAPSGDNSQPWEFKIDGDSILLFNASGKDATLYNFQERGSYLSHGAVIENLVILAPTLGFITDVQIFPPGEKCVAKVTFYPGPKVDDILAVNISKRSTNRKPYNAKKSLDEDDRKAFMESISSQTVVSIHIADKENVPELARLVSLNERLLFENKPLHDFLFGMIRWSRDEERAGSGLYIKTMEFPLPLQFLMRYVFSNFAVVEQLNAIGLSKFIPSQSSKGYLASSAFAALTITDTTPTGYVAAGRAVQRFWLTVEKRGMNAQPVTGIPYLAERIRAGEGSAFSEEHQKMILETDKAISKIFGLTQDQKIAMLMRVGYGSNPSARSMKHPPKIVA